MAKKLYTVEALVCDTIRSAPVDRKQANQLKKATKQKLGKKAKIKIKGA